MPVVKKNLILLGMMAVGKTTLGKIVAKRQNLTFIDTDVVIEKKNLMTISEIFKKKGEKFFRMEEEKQILKLLKKDNHIIALGGGAFMNKILRDNILKNAVSIWLDVPIEILNSRIKKNLKRPLLDKKNNQSKLEKLYKERKNIYKLANYKIDCEKLNKEDIAKKIITFYEKY